MAMKSLREGHHTKAATLFRKAARDGNQDAFYMLGVMHQTGFGVKRSDRDAAILFRHIALKGHARAQTKLGALYAAGRGVKMSKMLAVMWYDVAAMNKSKEAPDLRAKLAIGMKPDVTQRASEKARDCFISKYKNCD